MTSVRTRVPLNVGPDSRIPAEIASFEGLETNKEHVAIVFGKADKTQQVPLVRIHSECLTGDVFHSSRCDCGEQLNEAMLSMEKQGGVLLYLRQEGRGIGLYNKIDAYKHQIDGMDTFAANNHLGFEDDMRDFSEAAQMLKALKISKVRLLTNNPKKAEALVKGDISVLDVINTSTFIKSDNLPYLAAKAKVANHSLNLISEGT